MGEELKDYTGEQLLELLIGNARTIGNHYSKPIEEVIQAVKQEILERMVK